MVFLARNEPTGEPVEPGVHDLIMLAANSERLPELRKRLAVTGGATSWFRSSILTVFRPLSLAFLHVERLVRQGE